MKLIKTAAFTLVLGALMMGASLSVYASNGTTDNTNVSWDSRWEGSGDTWRVKAADGNGYLSDCWFNDNGNWYLIGCFPSSQDNTLMSAGLVYELSTRNFYLLNPNHDGTYGRMITGDENGDYTLNYNGVAYQLKFNTQHDGTYGRIIAGYEYLVGSDVPTDAVTTIPIAQ